MTANLYPVRRRIDRAARLWLPSAHQQADYPIQVIQTCLVATSPIL
jgi:hypothetical protein